MWGSKIVGFKTAIKKDKRKGHIYMSTMKEAIGDTLVEVRKEAPLVHSITNYVTVNDCANVALAIGASPIMADDIEETADITAISKALVINIGTLNTRTVQSMIASGKRANELGIPVIFDPVGAGASHFRNEMTEKLLKEVAVSIIRGNLSEVSFIAGLEVFTKGVDTAEEDEKRDSVEVARRVAQKFHCVVAITGAVDTITDGREVVKIENGVKLLSKVTGTGCMTSVLVGAYAGVNEDYFVAAIAGVLSMAVAGEIAYENAGNMGMGSFHVAIIDALSKLEKEVIMQRARLVEIR